MVMPVVWKCNCDPFGSNIGGTNPAFWQYKREAQWDSWLTIGETGGNPHGDISAIGFKFDTWNTTEFDSDDGAVFFMNPDNPNAPSGEAVVAQLTIPTGQDVYASVSLQGRATQVRLELGFRSVFAQFPWLFWLMFGSFDAGQGLARGERHLHVRPCAGMP